MGHYASEMGLEDEWARERQVEEERLQRMAERIQKDIDSRGIAYALAKIARKGESSYT